MALGQQLREARLRKNVTTTQVAAATQILTHILEDIEQENFSRISAPVYAKGFIKLYARYVGLDPQPLIQEYMTRFARGSASSLKTVPPRQAAKVRSQAGAVPNAEPEPVVEPITQPEPPPEPMAAAAPPPAAEPEPVAPAEPMPPLSGLRSVAADLARAGAGALKKGWASMGKDRQDIHTDLRRRSWLKNRPAGSFLKYIPLALGVILILVFLISSLSRLHGKKPTPEPVVAPLNEPKEEIRLVSDPPAPYLD
jgi:hypothetical protein